MKKQLIAAVGVFIITILTILLVCPGLYTAEETLPTPEEIIAKNIEAIGGIKALNKIKNKKTVTINKGSSGNFEIRDTIYWERPNNYYQSADTGVKSGYNGKIAWSINPHSRTRLRLYEGDDLSRRLFLSQFDGLDGPDVSYKSMKTEGIEQINGKDCYKVVKTTEMDFTRTVYYDKESFLIVKITRDNNKAGQYYEDYRKVNGILFAFKKMGGEIIIYETIECNIEMPEGIFDIPEEIKAIMDKNETEQHAQQ